MDSSASATILHVDMDAFFAAVELLDRPDLIGRPAVVARDSSRAVVTSATYEARAFGVHSAMPLAHALRLCPAAVVLEPHLERYRAVSARVMAIFREVTPLVEPLSIDEAFLDVAGARRRLGSPRTIAEGIRARVREQTGLTCSVGAAGTKFVAKLASGRAKPDGLLVVPAAETVAYLRPLPVGALWGVGAKTVEALTRLGIHTIGDLADTPPAVVRRTVGAAHGAVLTDLAHGIDPRPVTPETPSKSIGHEQTFEHDVHDAALVRRELLHLAHRTAARLRHKGLVARTVSLKLRYGDFRTVTRSRTLAEATDVAKRLHEEVVAAYDGLGTPDAPVRLIGVRAEQLEPAADRVPVLWDPDAEWRSAERGLDEVAERFGPAAVRPASLVGRRGRPVGDTTRPRGE